MYTPSRIARKVGWLVEGTTTSQKRNTLRAAGHWIAGSHRLRSLPVAIKVDISPLCNLRCVACIHAWPDGNPRLAQQRFHQDMKMSLERFETLVDEVRGRTSALSLYYYGEPYCHPQVDDMAGYARQAGLNIHVSTNFSFPFSDARLQEIATSGVTHLAVCVDGMRQDTYAKTRVGGRIDVVLDNLARFCATKRRLGLRQPEIEVQYLLYPHNAVDLPRARATCRDLGVDRLTVFTGAAQNCTDIDPECDLEVRPRRPRLLPRCYWPYFFMVVKYDGDVLACCDHRVGTQYTDHGPTRALGNVFDAGVEAVWNGEPYQAARRFTRDPRRINQDDDPRHHFCYGCQPLFHVEGTGRGDESS